MQGLTANSGGANA